MLRTNDVDFPQACAFSVGHGRHEQSAVVDLSFVTVHVLGVKLNAARVLLMRLLIEHTRTLECDRAVVQRCQLSGQSNRTQSSHIWARVNCQSSTRAARDVLQ